MSKPKITIITATYNAVRYLPRCRDSIVGQTYADWEWIIQDGGSTDGTLDILSGIADARVSVVSEPDSGVYDAWNKALARSSGDWVIFLGADDFLFGRDILEQCAGYLRDVSLCVDLAYGALFFLQPDGSVGLRLNRSFCAVYREMLWTQGVPFPSTFIRGSSARKAGFDTTFRIAGDFAFAASLLTLDNLTSIPLYITGMQSGGLSDDPRHLAEITRERARIMEHVVTPRAAELLRGLYEHLEADAVPSLLNSRALRKKRKWDKLRRRCYRLGLRSPRIMGEWRWV